MAKPESPLTELAARWCPIFADPERDYGYLTVIRSFCRSGSGGRFKLATDNRTPVHLVATFVRPEVVRIQAYLDAAPPVTPVLVSFKAAAGDIEVATDGEAVALHSAPLTLPAKCNPWRLVIHDARGQEVLRQQRQDRALPIYGSYPTGYSRHETRSSWMWRRIRRKASFQCGSATLLGRRCPKLISLRKRTLARPDRPI